MKRWILPAGLAAWLAVATLVTTSVGSSSLPQQAVLVDSGKISVGCPALTSATATVNVAGAATGSIQTSALATPNKTSSAKSFVLVTSAKAPVRVTADRSAGLTAATFVTAGNGPERGLSVVQCASAAPDHWFSGVDLSSAGQAELTLVNLDSTRASVDLTVYGADGRSTAPQGLDVAGGASITQSLGLLTRQKGAATLRVSSTEGRVAAFVRQLTWKGTTAQGTDWVPSSTASATDLVVPGIPAGAGTRQLVITNPGNRTASVNLDILGTNGRSDLADADWVEVPPQTTRTVDLTNGLDGAAAAVSLSSSQAVVAGVLLGSNAKAGQSDPAFLGAVPALPSDSVWPLAAGKSTTSKLQLVNAGKQDATATVLVTSGSGGTQKQQQVSVVAGASVLVKLPSADTQVVRIQTASTSLSGALVLNGRLGKIATVAVLGLSAEQTTVTLPSVRQDARLGG